MAWRAIILALLLAGCATVPVSPVLDAAGPIQVEFVGQGHWLMKPATKVAASARDEFGGEWLLINTDADMRDLVGAIQHEMAHILAWRLYGENIEEHGPEFRAICRQLVTRDKSRFCG